MHEGRTPGVGTGRPGRGRGLSRMHLAAGVAVVAFLQHSAAAHEDHGHSHGAADTLRVTAGDSAFTGHDDAEYPFDLTLEATGMRFHLGATGSGVLEDEDGALYEAVLYVGRSAPLGESAADDVLAGGYAKRIELHLLRDFEEGALVRHLEPAFKGADDVPGNMRDYFFGQLAERLPTGRTAEFTWVPGLGLNTYLAGHWHPVIQSRRFADALLAFWLG
jgi:hypothetical protein